MKKYIILIGLILYTSTQISPQSSLAESYRWTLPQTIPSTPQSQIIEKYVNHKISECNGLPEISIPLGEISVKGMNIPIILSYHASGVKYMQYDGDIGAGWSINIGGYRISRNINGKCDFSYNSGRDEWTELELLEEQNYLIKDLYLGRLALPQIPFNRLFGKINNDYPSVDGEYDLFTFNIPTTSGHFIMPDARHDDKCIILGDQLAKASMNISTGQMQDDAGNSYYFGLNQNVENIELEYDGKKAVGWPLNRIKTPFNDIIDFEYVKYSFKARRDRSLPYDYLVSDANLISRLICLGEYFGPSSTSLSADIKNRDQQSSDRAESYYVKQIKTDDILVKFTREDKEIISGNSPNLITSIEITDKNTGYSKIIRFEYKTLSYSSGKYSHYLLKSMSETDNKGNRNGKNYNFEYYEPQFSHPEVFLYPDQWGYYKQGSGIQKLTLHSEFGADKFIDPASPSTGVRYREMNEILRNSNYGANRTKAGIPEAFSLKKIIYPTGGYTEYIYESNRYDNYIGGGIRIKSIVSDAKETTNPKVITSTYSYKNGVPSFSLNEDNFRNHTTNMSLYYNSNGYYLNYGQSRLYSMFPTGDVPMEDFQVCYENVEVAQYTLIGGDTIKNGRTDFEFIIPQRYKTEPMISGSGDFPLLFATYSRLNKNNSGVYVSESSIAYAPFYLKSKIYRDPNLKILQSENYEYAEALTSSSYRGIKVIQKVNIDGHRTLEKDYSKRLSITYGYPLICPYGDYDFFLNGDGLLYAYTYIKSFFTYKFYYIKSNKLLPKTKITKVFSSGGQDPVTTTESYEYDSMNRLTKTIQSNSTDGTVTKELTYPPVNSKLASSNMLSTIIETVTTHNGKEIGRISHNYQGGILPVSTQTSASGINSLKMYVSYDKYDIKGNLLQYTSIDGVSTSYLWSYNYRYPVAEIVNATYDEIVSVLNINAASLATNLNPDENTINKINELRISLPKAMVSVYTYKPLVGIQSATDPSGKTTYYDYDTFGRLREVYVKKKNSDGSESKEILNQYYYNYQSN